MQDQYKVIFAYRLLAMAEKIAIPNMIIITFSLSIWSIVCLEGLNPKSANLNEPSIFVLHSQ